MSETKTTIKVQTISEKAFLRLITNTKNKYCFIIGAGASVTSKIPSGETLAKQWFAEIEEDYEGEDKAIFEQWLEDKAIKRPNLAAHYSDIFDRRFINKKEGAQALEKLIENAEPAFGYSVLAKLLSDPLHNVVITTNFDSLIEDALFLYGEKRPLVLGHEVLAEHFGLFKNRPKVLKIHRDLLLNPANKKEETVKLNDNWKSILDKIFENYIPIVIGYGGNDGSLMGYLNNCHHITDGIIWAYRKADGKPHKKILETVGNLKGKLLPITGFDELMMAISHAKGYEFQDKHLIKKAEIRAENYREQVERLTKSTDEKTKTKIVETVEKGDKNWWYYGLKAENAKTNKEKEAIYLDGLKQFPNSVELNTNYAALLHEKLGRFEEAEAHYKKALAINPDNDSVHNNYAALLHEKLGRFEEAEAHYKKALAINPDDDFAHNNYANLLKSQFERYDEAEKHYLKALTINPDYANAHNNYADLLVNHFNNFKEAEAHFKKALELKPDDIGIQVNYAEFLILQERYEDGQSLITKALANSSLTEPLSLCLFFMQYAFFPKQRKSAKQKLDSLLKEGVKHKTYRFSDLLAAAEKKGDVDMEELKTYANKINGK